MQNNIHNLMDVVALASAALFNAHSESVNTAGDEEMLFNIWITEENGNQTLVRENVHAQLSAALVSAANHGATIRGLGHRYEAVPVTSDH